MLGLSVALLALQPAAEPQLVFHDQLHTRMILEGDEAKIWAKDMQVVFPPSGALTGKAIYRSGNTVIAEKTYSEGPRAGAIVQMNVRGISPISMGQDSGPRSIEFILNDKSIGKLDFVLTKRSSGDAFDPKVNWLIDGPWNSHAFFTFPIDRGANQRVDFVFWVGSQELPSGSGEVEVVLKRGSTVLGRAAKRRVEPNAFHRFQQNINLTGNTFLTMGAIAGMNGDLRIEVLHNGQAIKTYLGKAAAGAFSPHPRSIPGQTTGKPFLAPRYFSPDQGALAANHVFWVTTD
jgi:hypothetical protein